MDPNASSDPKDHERPLAHLADAEPGPPPSADTLTDIVARYRRRRTRALGGALVVALLAGPAVGFAVGRAAHRGSGQTVATAAGGGTKTNPQTPIPRQDTASAGISSGGMAWSGSGTGAPPVAKRLFLRDAVDGVRVRVYLQDFPTGVEPGMPAECFPKQFLNAQVSDAVMVGTAQAQLYASTPRANPVFVVGAQPVGDMEGSPVTVVSSRTAADVARVKATFAGGVVDEMAPVDGWAVLAGHRPPASKDLSSGTLTAYDAAGRVLATVDLMPAPQPAMPVLCRGPVLPPGVPVIESGQAPPPPTLVAPPAAVAATAPPTTAPAPATTTTPTTRP